MTYNFHRVKTFQIKYKEPQISPLFIIRHEMGIKDVNFRSYDYKFYTLISSRYGFNAEKKLTAKTCIKYEK